MVSVKCAEEFISRIDRALPSVTITNGVPSGEAVRDAVAAGDLFEQPTDGGLLILTRANGFYRLKYMLTDPSPLLSFRPDATVAVEAAHRASDGRVDELFDALVKSGWKTATKRVRLTRPAGDAGFAGDADGYEPTADEALEWLKVCFSPLTGCLPGREELERDIKEGRLLASRGALLRYRASGNVAEIRHLAVTPEYRRRGLARALVARFLKQNPGRTRVWTGEDNAPALALYGSFGFSPDGTVSRVAVYTPEDEKE